MDECKPLLPGLPTTVGGLTRLTDLSLNDNELWQGPDPPTTHEIECYIGTYFGTYFTCRGCPGKYCPPRYQSSFA